MSYPAVVVYRAVQGEKSAADALRVRLGLFSAGRVRRIAEDAANIFASALRGLSVDPAGVEVFAGHLRKSLPKLVDEFVDWLRDGKVRRVYMLVRVGDRWFFATNDPRISGSEDPSYLLVELTSDLGRLVRVDPERDLAKVFIVSYWGKLLPVVRGALTRAGLDVSLASLVAALRPLVGIEGFAGALFTPAADQPYALYNLDGFRMLVPEAARIDAYSYPGAFDLGKVIDVLRSVGVSDRALFEMLRRRAGDLVKDLGDGRAMMLVPVGRRKEGNVDARVYRFLVFDGRRLDDVAEVSAGNEPALLEAFRSRGPREFLAEAERIGKVRYSSLGRAVLEKLVAFVTGAKAVEEQAIRRKAIASRQIGRDTYYLALEGYAERDGKQHAVLSVYMVEGAGELEERRGGASKVLTLAVESGAVPEVVNLFNSAKDVKEFEDEAKKRGWIEKNLIERALSKLVSAVKR